MSRLGALLLILAVLAFIASTLFHALLPDQRAMAPAATADPGLALSPWQGFPGGPAPRVDLPALFLRPEGLGMAGLGGAGLTGRG